VGRRLRDAKTSQLTTCDFCEFGALNQWAERSRPIDRNAAFLVNNLALNIVADL
jgi:hypothetical protein